MISFTEYRKRRIVEADESVPAAPADSSVADDLNAEIEKEIGHLFDNIKRVLYNRAVPNKAGTGFLGGLRNWWWRLWYGDPTKNRDHPMYSKGGWNKEPDLDYRRGAEAPAAAAPAAKTESVVPRLRLMAEWNRVIDEAEQELQTLTEDATNWADIERAIDSMKEPFIQQIKSIISRHGAGGATPAVPGKPAAAPSSPSAPAAPGKPAAPAAPAAPGAVGDLEPPAKGVPGGAVADPEKLADSPDTPPPPHVVKTSEREPGDYPAGLRVDGRRGTLKGHTHDVLYKTYREAKNTELTASHDLAKAVEAGTNALHKKLDELPLKKMKELGLAYGWHPPSFAYSSYKAPFMKAVLTFYIRKELGEHPPLPRVLKDAGYTGDGFTPHTPKPPKAKAAPGTTPPGTGPVPPATTPTPGTTPAPGTTPGSSAPPAGTTPPATTPTPASAAAAGTTPPGTDENENKVKALTDAFHKVNWPMLAKAVSDGSVKAGTDPWIDPAKLKDWMEMIGDWQTYDQGKWAGTVFVADTKAPADKRLNRAVTNLADYGVQGSTPEEMAQKLINLARLYPNGGSPDPAPSGTDSGSSPAPGDAPAASTPASDPAASSSPAASADPKVDELKKSIKGYMSFDEDDKVVADKLTVTAAKAGLDGDQTNTAFKNYLKNHSDLKGPEMDAILGDEEKVRALAGVSPAAASTPEAPPLPTDAPKEEPVSTPAAAPAAAAAPAPSPTPAPTPAPSPAVGDLEPPVKGTPAGAPAPAKAAPEPEDEKTIPRVAKASPEENLEKVQKWRTDNEAAYKAIMGQYQAKFPDDKEHVGGSLLNTILIHYPSWSPEEVSKVMKYIADNSDDADDVANWAEPKGAGDGVGLGRAFALAHGQKATDVANPVKAYSADIPKNDDLRSFQPKDEDKKAKRRASSRQDAFDAVFGGAGKKATDWGSREKMADMVFTASLDHVDKQGKFSGHYRYLTGEKGMPSNDARRMVMNLLKGYVATGEYPEMEVSKEEYHDDDQDNEFRTGRDLDRYSDRIGGGGKKRRKRLEEYVEYYKQKLRNQAQTGYVKQPDRVEMSGMSISERVNYLRSLMRERV